MRFLPASSHGQVGIADISLQVVWGSMNFVRYMQGEVPAPRVVALH